MTPRNLFNIILKILGLFFVKDFIQAIPQLVASIIYYSQQEGIQNLLTMIAGTILILIFYAVVAYQLLFNTNKILNVLKLEHCLHQEETLLENELDNEDFSFDFSAIMVLTTALIVIVGIIFINEIPNICMIAFDYFKGSVTGIKPSFDSILPSIIKIVLALLLIGERKRIISFILSKQPLDTKS